MKNAVLKVKFEAIGDESSDVAAARLNQAAMALETSPDMQFGLTVLRRVHTTEEGYRQCLTIFFGSV